MCQPPEISLPGGGEALEAANSGEGGWNSQSTEGGWVSPSPRAQADVTWCEDGLHTAAQDANLAMNTLASHGQSLFMNSLYSQHQTQQQQQQQRAAQLAALASMGQPGSAWSQGLGLNLAEKLQRAAAMPHGKPADMAAAASLPWLTRQQAHASPAAAPARAAAQMWPVSPVMGARPGATQMMSTIAPQLVAQGVPLGMAPLGQMDMYGQQHEDDDDPDPKKYKRMMSNRASAKRSRQRRQERLDELEIVSAKLQVENSTVQRRLNEANERIRKFQKENEALQEELRALKDVIGGKGAPATTANSTPDNASPDGTSTKQDSCGQNASTADHPSSGGPSSTPSQWVHGKRRHDEMAESEFQGSDYDGEAEAGAKRRAKIQSEIPVTTSSSATSNAGQEGEEAAVALPAWRGRAEAEMPEDVGILDDDLFVSIMNECFEAKPLEADLARH